MAEKIKLTATQVLADMKGDPLNGVAGLDRKGLKAKYGLSHSDMQQLFKHPALKNKKVKKEAGFEFEDDTVTEGDAVTSKVTDQGEALTGIVLTAGEEAAAEETAPAPQETVSAPIAEAPDKW